MRSLPSGGGKGSQKLPISLLSKNCGGAEGIQSHPRARAYGVALGRESKGVPSCEYERVFSQARKLVTYQRNRLGPEVIEVIELQKDWRRKGVVESPLLLLIGRIERLQKAAPQVTP